MFFAFYVFIRNDIDVDPKRLIRPGQQPLPSYGGTSVPRGANSPSDSQKGCPKGGVVNMDDNTLICMKVAEGISLFPIVWVMVIFFC